MSTRHLVDADIAPLLDVMPPTDWSTPIPELRAMSRWELPPPVIAPEVRTIDGPNGPVEVYLFVPAERQGSGAVLHIHGGGMIMGSVATFQAGPAGLAQNLGVPVASVEYRLAPEHPFPAPQEDCYAALKWLSGEAEALGIDAAKIVVAGESAGGGLAAAVALMARDRGGPPLAGQVLTYPMLDHRTGGPDCQWKNPGVGEFVWTPEGNRIGWGALKGDYAADDDRKGWFSPALADDLSGLPATWIGTGSLDLFFDEDLDYARRLAAARVPVELHSYPGAVHAFNLVPEAGISKQFNADMLGALSRMVA
ncbi:alpha/beta hydrolase [Tsuneonella rigui]|uniref:alpha/beta hydrolase n=1 Tax=Tsuneonella rigui TaxID=1708790 RepID=UPI000F7F8E01|nr:alpha/beta hydrolase [Tsuneonella rigui]